VPVIFLLLSNTLKMIVFHSASTVDDKHLSTQLHDNVYIVGCLSNNIHRLRPDGTFIDIILTEEDNVNYPITCCFNGNYRKLYVVNNYGNERNKEILLKIN
jgi:hypothetical protein